MVSEFWAGMTYYKQWHGKSAKKKSGYSWHSKGVLKTLVTETLLDSWNVKGQYTVQSKGYMVKSQELSALCCGSYLTNEIIHLLISKYCDAANDHLGRSIFAMLPSHVSTQFQTSTVHNLNANVRLSTVETIFIPIHRDGNHWGLLVINAKRSYLEYDNGFHCPWVCPFKNFLTRHWQTSTR